MAAMSKIARYKMRRGGEWHINFFLNDDQEEVLRDILRTSESVRYRQYLLEDEPQATTADYENAVAYNIYMLEIDNENEPRKTMSRAAADALGRDLLEEIAKRPDKKVAEGEGETEGTKSQQSSNKSGNRKKTERRVPLISLLPSPSSIELQGQRIEDHRRDQEPVRKNDVDKVAAAMQQEQQEQETPEKGICGGGEPECDFGEDGACWLCQLGLHTIGVLR